MYSIIFKYGAACVCFELAYVFIFLIIHILANFIKSGIAGSISVAIPYVSACASGFLGVAVGLAVVARFFTSVQPRIVVLIYYVIISVIMIIVFLTFFLLKSSEKTEPSWVLIQTLVSIISAWKMTEKNGWFGKF